MSNHLFYRSAAAAACGQFAAERPADRHIDRQRREPARNSNGASARRSAANASSVTLTAEGRG